MRVSFAVWRPVDYHGLSQRTTHNAVVLHTNGGVSPNGSLFNWFSSLARGDHGPKRLHEGSHFQVAKDGTLEQYVDTSLVLGHAWDANRFALGIETEDEGKPAQPWTDAQLDTIVRLLKELGVPPTILPEGGGDGVGWHQLHDSWNQSSHNCPGEAKRKQIQSDVIPGLTEEDMTPDEVKQIVLNVLGVGSEETAKEATDIALAVGDLRDVDMKVKGVHPPMDKRRKEIFDFLEAALKKK
jgi:hypothetical protein